MPRFPNSSSGGDCGEFVAEIDTNREHSHHCRLGWRCTIMRSNGPQLHWAPQISQYLLQHVAPTCNWDHQPHYFNCTVCAPASSHIQIFCNILGQLILKVTFNARPAALRKYGLQICALVPQLLGTDRTINVRFRIDGARFLPENFVWANHWHPFMCSCKWVTSKSYESVRLEP